MAFTHPRVGFKPIRQFLSQWLFPNILSHVFIYCMCAKERKKRHTGLK